MKKLLILLLILSCSFICVDNPCEGFNKEEIRIFVHNYITYRKDFIDEWDSPAEILESREGDCEEYCILYMHLLKINFGIEAEMLFVVDGFKWHYIVKDGKYYYDVTNPYYHKIGTGINDWKIIKTYSYNDVMNRATSFYTKGKI